MKRNPERGEVHVYLITDQLPVSEKIRISAFISPKEEEEVRQCINPAERDLRRLFRGFLRETLANYCETPPGTLQFTVNNHGKPALGKTESQSPIQFNLSHSASSNTFGNGGLPVIPSQ